VTRTERILAAAILVGVAAHFALGTDLGERNWEFLPDMATSVAYDAQASNPNFPDGKTLQPPPPGTIARGFPPLFAGETPLDTTTPWEELPAEQRAAWDGLAAPPDADADRGRIVFARACTPCHGAGGLGDGEVTKRGVPPPPSLLGEGARTASDGHLFRIVTGGQGNMPPYAPWVERKDRWNVVRYLRGLQTP